jgi:ATP phosphoribosyltransferase
MATRHQTFRGGVFIDYSEQASYYKKSGRRVIESVLAQENSFRLVGSDVVDEYYTGDSRVEVDELEAVRNSNGDELRFAVLTASGIELTAKRYVTSYPTIARRLLGDDIELVVAGGSIESEIVDLGIPGFELVQTGNSVRENGLQISIDELARVSLCRVTRRKDINDEK